MWGIREESRACRVYPAYQRALREHGGEGALDLDDLLLAVLDLFQQQPQVRARQGGAGRRRRAAR